MVVPRSSVEVTHDGEFTLFAVTTFKKYSAEFQHKCREMRWTPRDYKYVEGGVEEERKEVEKVSKDERKIWGEALRLGRTGWSESVMIWIHVLTLRVFVETVLRYGLPLDYVSALVKVCFHIPLRTYRCLTDPRQLPNRRRRRRRYWTRHTHILVGMLSDGTRKGRSQRTIPLYHQKWQQQVLERTVVKVMSIRPTFITSLRFCRYCRTGHRQWVLAHGMKHCINICIQDPITQPNAAFSGR